MTSTVTKEYNNIMDCGELSDDFSISDYHYNYNTDATGGHTINFKDDSEYKRMFMVRSDEYKYDEDVVLTEIEEYIDSTYKGHYTNKNNSVQGLDIWKARGTMSDSCIDTSIKYLLRYGKKEGRNRKDLLKAAHYIILALGNERS